MSIKELSQKIKGSLAVCWDRVVEHEKDLWLTIMVILVAVGGFGLGRLSTISDTKEPVRIEQVDLDGTVGPVTNMVVSTEKSGVITNQNSKTNLTASVGYAKGESKVTNTPVVVGKVVASKNGTKYYLPNCPSVKRIKEENKIWFASIEEAKQAGYSPAANCPGL